MEQRNTIGGRDVPPKISLEIQRVESLVSNQEHSQNGTKIVGRISSMGDEEAQDLDVKNTPILVKAAVNIGTGKEKWINLTPVKEGDQKSNRHADQRTGPSLTHGTFSGEAPSDPAEYGNEINAAQGGVQASQDGQRQSSQIANPDNVSFSINLDDMQEKQGPINQINELSRSSEMPSASNASGGLHRRITIKITDERDQSAQKFDAKAFVSVDSPQLTNKDHGEDQLMSGRNNQYLETEANLIEGSERINTEAFEAGSPLKQKSSVGQSQENWGFNFKNFKRMRTMRDIFSQKHTSGIDVSQADSHSIGLIATFKYAPPRAKRTFACGLVAALYNGAIGCTHAIIIAQLIKCLSPYAEEQDTLEALKEVFVYAFPLSGAMLLLGYLQNALLQSSAATLNQAMRGQFIRSLLAQEVQYFEQLDLENLPQEITDKFESVITCVGERIGKICFAVGAIAGSLALSLLISPSFTLGLLIALPSILCLGTCLSKCLFQRIGVQAKLEAEMADLATETLKSMRLIVAAGEERRTIKKFVDLQEQTHQQGVQSKFIAISSSVVYLGLFMSFILYAWALVGIFEENKWTNGHGTGETISITDSYICMEAFVFAFIFVPVLLTQTVKVNAGRQDATNLMKLIDRDPLVRSITLQEGQVVKLISFSKAIGFKRVSFKYPNAPEHALEVLSNASFSVEPGHLTTLVGLPKSGKTTILKLLHRLYDPTEGDIYFGSQDNLRSLDLNTFRQMVGYIEAEPTLLRGSILNNIKLGGRGLDGGMYVEAIKLANAEFVFKLKDEMNTLVGYEDRGVKLTLSQKHRLAIARAIVSNPKLILIDHNIADLDFKSQAEVDIAINNVLAYAKKKGITVVMATNKLQRVEQADRVIYIQSPSSIVTACKEKQTGAYEKLMDQLRQTLFAGQQDLEDMSIVEDEPNRYNGADLGKDSILRKASDLPRQLSADEQKSVNRFKSVSYGTEVDRVLAFSNSSWKLKMVYLLILLNSLCYPTLAYLIIRLQLFFFSYSSVLEAADDFDDYFTEKSTIFAVFAAVVLVSFFLQLIGKSLLASAGHEIESNMRLRVLRAILFRQVSWLDKPQNSVAYLTQVLTKDVRELTDAAIGRVFGNFEIKVTVLASVVFGLVISWQNTIFLVCMGPVVIFTIHDFKQLLTRETAPTYDSLPRDDNSSVQHSLLVDLVQKHGMIAAMSESNRGLIHQAYEQYYCKRSSQHRSAAHRRGLRLGMAQAGRNLILILAFFCGYEVCLQYLKLDRYDVVVTIILLFFIWVYVGLMFGALPTIDETESHARNVFFIIDEESTLDVRQPSLLDQQIRFGDVSIKNLTFSYGNDPQPILFNVNIEMPAQARIGLVGNKGCGKSSVAHILRRFYDPSSGDITIDGTKLIDYSATRLRSQIYHLTQEPEILNISIRENIALGRSDVSAEQIYRAALLANATGFIEDAESNEAKRRANIQSGLKFTVANLKQKFPNFSQFATVEIRDDVFQTDLYQLVLDTLKFADLPTLMTIHSSPNAFVEFAGKALGEVGDHTNLTWLEFVLMIEWNDELQAAIKEKNLDEETLKAFEGFSKRHAYDFDSKSVLNSLEAFLARQGGQKVENYVLRNQIYRASQKSRSHFIMRQRQRHEQLVTNLLDKMRNASGLFVLGPGFSRSCGKNGCNLTASQKQRIAIARALLNNPKIMILDQVTAGLDEQGRQVVGKAMEQAMEGRTSLLISAQDSYLSKCDKIYVMSNQGTILEEGTHSDLVGNPDSHYNRFIRSK